MRTEDARAALAAFETWWQVETGGEGGRLAFTDLARFAWLAAWQVQAERGAALAACLRELVEAQEGQTALDFPGADLRAVAAYERYQAALAQARALLEEKL